MALERFHEAQAGAQGYARALAEIQSGRKRSHWIWYVFPQLAELGRSSTAKFYGLSDVREARDYLRDATLRARLLEITGAVAAQVQAGVEFDVLMGSEIDALKLVSSLTLFEAAGRSLVGEEAGLVEFVEVCGRVLERGAAEGRPRCEQTLRAVTSGGSH